MNNIPNSLSIKTVNLPRMANLDKPTEMTPTILKYLRNTNKGKYLLLQKINFYTINKNRNALSLILKSVSSEYNLVNLSENILKHIENINDNCLVISALHFALDVIHEIFHGTFIIDDLFKNKFNTLFHDAEALFKKFKIFAIANQSHINLVDIKQLQVSLQEDIEVVIVALSDKHLFKDVVYSKISDVFKADIRVIALMQNYYD